MNKEKLIFDIERWLDYKKVRHEYTQIEDEIEFLLNDYKTTKEELEQLKNQIIERIINGEFNI